jgi:hypothetical protein
MNNQIDSDGDSWARALSVSVKTNDPDAAITSFEELQLSGECPDELGDIDGHGRKSEFSKGGVFRGVLGLAINHKRPDLVIAAINVMWEFDITDICDGLSGLLYTAWIAPWATTPMLIEIRKYVMASYQNVGGGDGITPLVEAIIKFN